MKSLFKHTFAVAAFVASSVAQAGLIDASFGGVVDSQANSGFTLGTRIVGEFVYDTTARRYLSFVIGGQSVLPGFASTATLTPDRYSAIYTAQVSPLSGGSVNSTFNVDLEGLVPWAAGDALGLLLSAAQLASNLDTAVSSFGFYNANADGTNVRSLTGVLDRIAVTAVPEPASIALLLIGLTAFGLQRGRRAGR